MIKFLDQSYLVSDSKIKEVCFEVVEDETHISVNYHVRGGNLFKELAFIVPNDENTLDTKILSDLYIEIMTENHKFLEAKKCNS